MKKMFYAGALIMSMLSTQLAFADMAPPTPPTPPDKAVFTDVAPGSTYYKALVYLKDNELVSGYADGSFKPDNTINRAEFIKIIIMAVDQIPSGNDNCLKASSAGSATSTADGSYGNLFTDTVATAPGDPWYMYYVCEAKKQHLVDGYPDGSFKPAQNINFVEAAKIIANAAQLTSSTSASSTPWYKVYVDALATKNAIPTAIALFDQNITRGEMAEMAFRIKSKNTNLPSQTYASLAQVMPTTASITFNTGSYKISMQASSSWTVDEKALTLIKKNNEFWFNPDYSPGQPQNPQIQNSTMTTNGGKTLKITISTEKNDPLQGALVYVEDEQDPLFYFSFVTPTNNIPSEFYDMVKTMSWEKI